MLIVELMVMFTLFKLLLRFESKLAVKFDAEFSAFLRLATLGRLVGCVCIELLM